MHMHIDTNCNYVKGPRVRVWPRAPETSGPAHPCSYVAALTHMPTRRRHTPPQVVQRQGQHSAC
jgi:hypothetical protein